MQTEQILSEMLETMRRIETLLATANSQRAGMKPAGDLRSPPTRPIQTHAAKADTPPTPHDGFEHSGELDIFPSGYPFKNRCHGKLLSDCNSDSLRFLVEKRPPGHKNRIEGELCQAELDRRSGVALPGKFRTEPMPKRSEPMPPIDMPPENEEDQIPF